MRLRRVLDPQGQAMRLFKKQATEFFEPQLPKSCLDARETQRMAPAVISDDVYLKPN